MSQLRVSLPPLAELSLDSEVDCAWLDRQGQVTRQERMRLGALPKQPLVCFLHPSDSLLASIDLPPLPANKTVAAVQCAAQALMLGDSAEMHIAHSARNESGQVQIAWVSRKDLQHLGQFGLNLKGLYPAAYSLPVMAGGVGCLHDDHLLLRHGPNAAQVQPMIDEAWLLETGLPAHWIGDGAPEAVQSTLADTQRCSGPLPNWGLHGGLQQPGTEHRGWGRALGCCALALAVWVIGLNLYAAREAGQGQQLKAQMAQRVKQAFPELPVILNPLQQARQQIAARQQGAVDAPGQDFTRLVSQAGSGMPSMAGTVQRLEFVDGALQLSLLPEARRSGNDKDWQGTLAQAGISISPNDDGWVLRPAGEATAATDNDDSSGAEDE
ncbi:type II secretion system protein GspL [Pseudomonas fluorescens]|uniref:Type II secretion system protein GspL n=1 Tax=Pseudomonas fluorescens TaxID=294 RepID=A0A345UY61_PSEFL|nr:type II secretion system protein GspL [Pseudomonas fluorescens]AXJ05413.1 type II secretion system protein GspL [Pseudomonas fluorescens]